MPFFWIHEFLFYKSKGKTDGVRGWGLTGTPINMSSCYLRNESSVHCYSYTTWMTFQIVCQTVNRGCSLMTRILHMQIMIQVTLNHVLVRTYWIWTQTNVLKQNICWQDVAQGLIPLLLPISHKGRHSGGTGFNKITWCNNWRQTLLELPHWKTNQKDRLWNRGHETC